MPTRPSDAELDEFLTRGMAEVIVREDLAASLRAGDRQLRIKQGFDPTHPNLHLGHAVPLRKLRKLAEWGHEIVLIVGDWTTQIGDPTDKDETRPTMSHDKVMKNAETYLEQFHLIVPREGTRVVLQSEWFGKFGLKDVIDLASRFTTQQMLQREEFRKRLEKKTPIPIKDLLYPLLQAYDSVAIESDVEVGGTDQLFNILAGRELQEQVGQRPQNLLINHLLEGLDGEKMSKSKPKTGIWLTDPPERDLREGDVDRGQAHASLLRVGDRDAAQRGQQDPRRDRQQGAASEGGEGEARLADHQRAALAGGRRRGEGRVRQAVQRRRAARRDRGPRGREERPDASSTSSTCSATRRSRTSRSDALRLVKQGGVSVDGSKADLETMVPTDDRAGDQSGQTPSTRASAGAEPA